MLRSIHYGREGASRCANKTLTETSSGNNLVEKCIHFEEHRDKTAELKLMPCWIALSPRASDRVMRPGVLVTDTAVGGGSSPLLMTIVLGRKPRVYWVCCDERR